LHVVIYLKPTLYYAHLNAHNNGRKNKENLVSQLYDINAPKKSTNLSVNSDLLKRSKNLNVNLSATLEKALNEKLAILEREKWKAENKTAISAYNQYIEENGCFSDEYREV
jgi:antitoxin CcdA